MSHDRVSGAIKQAEDALKQAAGKMNADAKFRHDRTDRKTQGVMGGMKDALRDNDNR